MNVDRLSPMPFDQRLSFSHLTLEEHSLLGSSVTLEDGRFFNSTTIRLQPDSSRKRPLGFMRKHPLRFDTIWRGRSLTYLDNVEIFERNLAKEGYVTRLWLPMLLKSTRLTEPRIGLQIIRRKSLSGQDPKDLIPSNDELVSILHLPALIEELRDEYSFEMVLPSDGVPNSGSLVLVPYMK